MLKKYIFVLAVLGLGLLFGGTTLAQSSLNKTGDVQNQSGSLQNTGQVSGNNNSGLQSNSSDLLNNQNSSIKIGGSGVDAQSPDTQPTKNKGVSKWFFAIAIIFVFGIFIVFSYWVTSDKNYQKPNRKTEHTEEPEPTTETINPESKKPQNKKPKTSAKKKKKAHR